VVLHLWFRFDVGFPFVIRGFQEHSDKIQINTDARSNKVGCYALRWLAFFLFPCSLIPCYTSMCNFDSTDWWDQELPLWWGVLCRTLEMSQLHHSRWQVDLALPLNLCVTLQICWYFTDSWEQFRISGSIDVIDASNADPAKLQVRPESWSLLHFVYVLYRVHWSGYALSTLPVVLVV
jgi:hypothetical protein